MFLKDEKSFFISSSKFIIIFFLIVSIISSSSKLNLSKTNFSASIFFSLYKQFLIPNFILLKLGIKNSLYKEKNIDAERFVLDKFNLEELEIIEIIKKKIIINLELLIKKDFSSFKKNF